MSTDAIILDAPAGLSHHTRRRGMLFLGMAVACVAFALMLQMGLNDVFLSDDIHVSGFQRGLVESLRETCGIIALAVLALLSGLAEPLVGAAMLVLLAAGLGSYAMAPNYLSVLGLSMIWSQGLHVWMPLPNSMALGLAEPGQAGRRLGQINAAGSAGSFIAIGLAIAWCLWGKSHLKWESYVPAIRPLYVVAGAVAALGAVACLAIPRNIKTPGPRLIFRRKYALYYVLCLLEGWRKQVFLAFAGFMLVRLFHTDLVWILSLWGVTQIIGAVSSPLVGRLIDRVGERRVLLFYYITMICIFVGYAVVPIWGESHPALRYLLFVLFVLDGSFFTLAMSLTTYVNKIAPPSEHTATLSMGVAMNHVSAVTMPFVGGLLWGINPAWTFLLGCAAGVGSIIVARRLPRHSQ